MSRPLQGRLCFRGSDTLSSELATYSRASRRVMTSDLPVLTYDIGVFCAVHLQHPPPIQPTLYHTHSLHLVDPLDCAPSTSSFPVQAYPFSHLEPSIDCSSQPLVTFGRDLFSSIHDSPNATIIELSCSLVAIPHVEDLGSRPPRRCTRSATSPARPVMDGNG